MLPTCIAYNAYTGKPRPRRKEAIMAVELNISGHTHLVTLIGKPTGHSKSPVTHTTSFKMLGVDAVYLAFDIENEQIPGVLDAMRAMDGWDGSSVTMPAKQAVIPYLDGLSDAAELIGAVNTIAKDADGKLIGHNTDGAGFMENLRKNGVQVQGATMTLVGPGGAGSAILVQAALDGVAKLHVFARGGGKSYQHAEKLIEQVCERTDCDAILHALEDKEDLKACIAESSILANATNVGMGEGNTDTPVPAEFLRAGMAVADSIYLPLYTQLLQDAQAAGAKVVTGVGMLNEQAAVAEKIWYGVDMPVDEVVAAIAG